MIEKEKRVLPSYTREFIYELISIPLVLRRILSLIYFSFSFADIFCGIKT